MGVTHRSQFIAAQVPLHLDGSLEHSLNERAGRLDLHNSSA
jgi:hypothetical protein